MNQKCSWVAHLRCPIKSSKMYHNWQIFGEILEHCKYMLRKLENSYTTSKWDRESSVEVSSDSDNSYQTPPIMGLSQWDRHQGDQSSREDGEISLSLRTKLSLSSLQSQPLVPRSGGPTWTLKCHGHQTKGKLVKVSCTHSSKNLEETGSINLSRKQVRSLSPLEYTSDVPKEEREGSPDYLKWVPTDYFAWMQGWMATVDLVELPGDEEQAWARFRIGWLDETARAKAEAFQDFEDEEIEGLVDTHTSPVPHCG